MKQEVDVDLTTSTRSVQRLIATVDRQDGLPLS
jgi:hypothetical protein